MFKVPRVNLLLELEERARGVACSQRLYDESNRPSWMHWHLNGAGNIPSEPCPDCARVCACESGPFLFGPPLIRALSDTTKVHEASSARPLALRRGRSEFNRQYRKSIDREKKKKFSFYRSPEIF